MNRLKVFFSIIAAKLTHIVGNILGKGTSKPGQIALRIFPDVLNYIKLPYRSNRQQRQVVYCQYDISSAKKQWSVNSL